MSTLQTPPTEIEIADVIDVLNGAHRPSLAMVVRRLAFQRDTLRTATGVAAITTAVLVRELNSRMLTCVHGHPPELLALWPCYRCAVERATPAEPERT